MKAAGAYRKEKIMRIDITKYRIPASRAVFRIELASPFSLWVTTRSALSGREAFHEHYALRVPLML
jgi:hypothetical protein